MTFNVEEKHAVAGGLAAAGLPLATNIIGIDVEEQVVALADAVFEGAKDTASFVAGTGLTVLGMLSIGIAVYTTVDDWLGVALAGFGAGFLAMGAQAFDVAWGGVA